MTYYSDLCYIGLHLFSFSEDHYSIVYLPKRHRNPIRKKYDKLNEAVKKMRMPYYNVAEFIEDHVNKALEQYEKLIEEEK